MKKIFTLIAVALLGGAVSVNAEGEYVYNVPAGTTVIDSDVLNAAISEAAGNTAIKLVLPAGTYDVSKQWLLLSVISKFANSTALYSVDEIWQIPPPSPFVTCPSEKIAASLYPASTDLLPTTLL